MQNKIVQIVSLSPACYLLFFSGRAVASLKVTRVEKRLQMVQNLRQIRETEQSEVGDTVGCCHGELMLEESCHCSALTSR